MRLTALIFITLFTTANAALACGGSRQENSLTEFTENYSRYLIGDVRENEIVTLPAVRCKFNYQIQKVSKAEKKLCENKIFDTFAICEKAGFSDDCAKSVASCLHHCPTAEFIGPKVNAENRKDLLAMSRLCEAIRIEMNARQNLQL